MRQITITSLLLFLAPFSAAQTSQRESFAHATVSYDWVVNHSGQKLRTFITRPTAAGGKVPVIFFCRLAQLRHHGVSRRKYPRRLRQIHAAPD